MKKYVPRIFISSLIIFGCIILTAQQSRAQAMVTKGQEVLLLWFSGVTSTSFHSIQVEGPKGHLQFIVTFQLPEGSPGVNKKGYSLPLFWISEFGTFSGTGTVTPTGKVIARFHVKSSERP